MQLPRPRLLRLTILCAAAHFTAAMVSGVIAFGLDFDQLRYRSATSTAATYVHEFLMAPHSAVVRSMPNAWLTRPGLIPLLLVAHHLLWGAGAAAIVMLVRRRRASRQRS